MEKVVLITGASSGIGLETALSLCDKGYKVYGAARRIELMKPIEEKGGVAVYLDLYDDKSIVDCVNQIIAREHHIDVLINNSGFGLGGSIEAMPMEEVQKQFQVNVFGLSRITQLVLPFMRAQKNGRIINISSMAGRFSSPFTGWYHATKYSVEAISDALRLEVRPFGIKVSIIEPGTIQTDWGVIHAKNIRKYAGPSEYAQDADKVASWYEERYLNKGKIAEPKVISDAIIKAVTSKNPKLRYKAGTGSKFVICLRRMLSGKAFDFVIRKTFGI